MNFAILKLLAINIETRVKPMRCDWNESDMYYMLAKASYTFSEAQQRSVADILGCPRNQHDGHAGKLFCLGMEIIANRW